MDDDFLTVLEVALRFRLKPDTVRHWLRAGKIRGLHLGKNWLVPCSEVDRLLKGGDSLDKQSREEVTAVGGAGSSSVAASATSRRVSATGRLMPRIIG